MRGNALEKLNSFYDNESELIATKAKYFDKIAELFYLGNFGATNKSEIELLMFSIFMDEMIAHNQIGDGVLDYKACSDFRIAEMLGIPQQKVNNLKIRKQARYPQQFEWQKSFEAIKDAIIYDTEKKRIVIPVTDPNLYLSIRNFIEDHNGYIEIQRGSNVLQMRPDHFLILLYLGIDDEKEKEKVRNNFIKALKTKNEKSSVDDIYTDAELMNKVLEIGDEVFDFFEFVAEGVDNPMLTIVKSIRCIGKLVSKR